MRVFYGGGRIWTFGGSSGYALAFIVAMDADFTVLSNKIYSTANKILMAVSDGVGHTYFALGYGSLGILMKVNDNSYGVVWQK